MSQGHNWYTRSSKRNHQYGCASARSSRVNCHELRLAIYIKVLVFAVLLSRHSKKLFIAFNSQTNGQTKRLNSTIEAYLRAFINWEQDDWAKLLPMAEFTYNNIKNTSIGHTLFELNCGYYPRVSFEEDVDPRSRSCSANKLAEELKKLMEVYCRNLFYT